MTAPNVTDLPSLPNAAEPGHAARIATQSDDASFASLFDLTDLVTPPPPPGADPPAAEPAAATPAPGAAPQPAAPTASGTSGEPVEGEGEPPAGEPTADTPAEGFYQDRNGRWHRPDHTFASAEEITTVEGDRVEDDITAAGVAGAAPPAPPAAAAAPGAVPAAGAEAPKPGEPAAVPFVARQGADEVEIPPDLTFTYKVAGKDRTATADQLIRTVQKYGHFNAEREEQIAQGRAEIERFHTQERAPLVAQFTEMQTRLNETLANAQKLLEDEEYYYDARTRYQAENTPEKRVERAEQELERYRKGEAPTQQPSNPAEQAQTTEFVSRLNGALESLLAKYPEVSFEEMYGKFSILTAPMMRQGRVPTDQFKSVAQAVAGPLVQFMTSLHESRSVARQKSEEVVEAAKVETQKAKGTLLLQKRQLARTVAPSAGSRTAAPGRGRQIGTPTPAKPNPNETAAQSAERIVQEEMRAALAGG